MKNESTRDNKVELPKPTKDEVKKYLAYWDSLENYKLQEDALDKLFFNVCPKNTDISDILIKVSTLNDFYSTNIFGSSLTNVGNKFNICIDTEPISETIRL